MKWIEALNLFWNAGEEVKIPDSGPTPHIPAWLRLLTFEQIEQADDACRYFATHLEWPDMPCMDEPNVRYALYFRCLFASEMVRQAHEEGIQEPPGYEIEDIAHSLTHVLVHMWDAHGLEWADSVFPESGRSRGDMPT
jgi:hypothetical protein